MSVSSPSIRLYVDQPLLTGSLVTLDESRAHYLRHVMRRREGDKIAAFNAESGEWEASLRESGKRGAQLAIGHKISDARPCPDISFAFALIKNKSESMVEKATELGVRAIHAITTQHGVVKGANEEKLRAHLIEAAEQCERHDVPTLHIYKNLGLFLGSWDTTRPLLYGDESGQGKPLSEIIATLPSPKAAILVGPEGGFSEDEHRMLHAAPFAHSFGMGPRILRADTAGIAALACLMAAHGDWQLAPHFKGAS